MPSLFCFLHTIRGGLRWVKSPFLCDVCLYLAYLPVPVKSCITITTPASFLQFLTFFYAHRTCQELLDVPKANYRWVSHLSFSWIWYIRSLSLQTVQVHARRAVVRSVSQKKFWTFPTPIMIFRYGISSTQINLVKVTTSVFVHSN